MIASYLMSLAFFLAPAAGEAHGFFRNPDVWRVINLAVFLIVLLYIFRNKLRLGEVFEKRGTAIVHELEQARREKEEALGQLAQVEARLNRLDQEVASIQAEAGKEAEREMQRIREAAQSDAEKVRQAAQREIEGAMKAARTELRAFVAENSVNLAESMIRRDIRPEDNSRMLTKYIDELREVNR